LEGSFDLPDSTALKHVENSHSQIFELRIGFQLESPRRTMTPI
jgi:hypothetical protein